MSDVLERFIRYVQVDSQSDPLNEHETPSTARQHDMARLLYNELRELGCEDVRIDEHAYVTAGLPASKDCDDLPPLGLIAHVDSAPDAPGADVKPHVVHYEGGNLVHGVVNGESIETSPGQVPDLELFVGQDIVCSDGTTLLAADDKAGVAEIMALLARLKADKSLVHPEIRVAFVPDEEIGHGASLLNLNEFGATWAYTVDGEYLGQFSYECFNAADAVVATKGNNHHPGSGKDILVNALELLHEFHAQLPKEEKPEYTDGYEGFFHLHTMEGSVGQASAYYILRDFSSEGMERRKQAMRDAAQAINERHGEGSVELKIEDEYRNMAEQFGDAQFLIDNALEANRRAGIEPVVEAIRGGTDGAQLTFRGLPCPNLATGGYNFHSVREFIPVTNLERTVDMLVELVALFAQPQRS
ncbi:MAG: peptidase T [Atopobiaceae bacterium]|nr:peptidase T [Atopobiaceae bacterium]